jgi:hypothetical protein
MAQMSLEGTFPCFAGSPIHRNSKNNETNEDRRTIHPGCSVPVCFRLYHLLRQSQYAIARLFWFAAILSGLYRANHMERWLYHFPAQGPPLQFSDHRNPPIKRRAPERAG